MTRYFRRLPWFASAPLVVVATAGIAGFSYVFTSDLFNEECLNERNLLTGEFEASNCGEGAKVARAQDDMGMTPEPMDDGMTPEPMDDGMTPESMDDEMTPESMDDEMTPESMDDEMTPESMDDGMTPESMDDGMGSTPEPSPTAESEMTPAGPGTILRGMFQDGDPGHDGSGTAEIQRLDDGSLNVFLSNFSVTNGPDLFVVLTRDPGGEYEDGDLVLEPLRANNGNQNYAIPAGTDASQYGAVLIWCRAFDTEFAFATL